MNQIKSEHLNELFPNLVSFNENEEYLTSPTEEDSMTGFELYHVIVYCPTRIMKLFRFLDNLLTSESSGTIIQSVVNLFHAKTVKDKEGIRLMKDFYGVLATT